jgi:hypothetical protein
MNKFFSLLAIAIPFSVASVKAQQNLFNIPSGDITPKNKFFYQHQLNFYSYSELESKSHVVYGMGKSWDLGLNFVDLPLSLSKRKIISFNDSSNRKPLYPLFMFTLQKQFVLKAHDLFLNIGTQVGPNINRNLYSKEIAFMNYSLVRWQINKKGYVIGGLYHTNDVFVGGPTQNHFGFVLGYEYKLNDKWILMGDFISGSHKKSQTVLGAGYNLSGKLQVFLGSLLAFPNNTLSNGLVLEINWYGWNFKEIH